MLSGLSLGLTGLLAVAAAVPLDEPRLGKRCLNTFLSRDCWDDYDISTNYYEDGPDTGVVREYWFNIVNGTAAPDGVERLVLSVNGSVPGPTIEADWGDTIVVHVTNSLENNGTSIHFHGIRQLNTTEMDGVTSVTQCPIAPGDSFTYRWRATQYGTSWWHSHYYVQAWDGVFGGIIINGPATANYNVDKGMLFLNDWGHETPDTLLPLAEMYGPPLLENALIQGQNVYNDSGTVVGSRFETSFVTGLSYRFHIVNAAADTHFKFTIDGHSLTVIAADLVPIEPYTTNVLNVAIGQRYDVVVTANAALFGEFWMRAIPQSACSRVDDPGNVRGIVRYNLLSFSDPTTTAWPEASVDECVDEDPANLVPYVPVDALNPAVTDEFEVDVGAFNPNTPGRFYWRMGAETFINQWDYPTLQQVADHNSSWYGSQRVYLLPDPDVWVYWIIENTRNGPHPLHLHGHDSLLLGQGIGSYTDSNATLSLVNPTRRDVVLLPTNGYVVIAFKTDNPGTWVMHCHIAWHTSEGLAVQIVERESEILSNVDTDALSSTCTNFKAYTAEDFIVQDDSGI